VTYQCLLSHKEILAVDRALFLYVYCIIGGIMVCVFASSVVDPGCVK
jgi:hypothetical protein